MFTGIVERTARIALLEETGGGRRLTLRIERSPALPWREVALGESIAVSGVCLTAVASRRRGHDPEVSFDVVPETLARTTLGELSTGDGVNLERSLRVGDPLGGHYVTGHIDGTGRVAELERAGDQTLFRVELGPELARGVIPKGSVTVDGVSLTVIDVDRQAGWFTFAAIPHTLERTTLGESGIGTRLNIETDAFGKWVLQALDDLIGARGSSGASDERLRDLLERAGFIGGGGGEGSPLDRR